MLIGRRTYEALEKVPVEVRDEGFEAMRTTTGWLFSYTLEAAEWPGLSVVRDDLVGFVRELKVVFYLQAFSDWSFIGFDGGITNPSRR